MTAQHQGFLNRLDGSRPAVNAVAEWIRSFGVVVVVPETRRAPSADVHEEFADNGDIFLPSGRIVEVKHIVSTRFTCAADWPHPEFFVDAEARVARLIENAAAWIIVSADYAAIGIAKPQESREHWYVRKNIFNRNTGNFENFMVCPLEHIEFRPFPKRFVPNG